MSLSKYANVVLEMEGILLEPSAHGLRELTGAARRIFKNQLWREYEKGKLSRGETCQRLAKTRSIPLVEVQAAADDRLSWNMTPHCEELLDVLKGTGNRLYCTINVAREEWDIIRAEFPHLWRRFEGVSVSCASGITRPCLSLFRDVLKKYDLNAAETIFIDDDIENLQFSRALGVKSLLYRGYDDLLSRMDANHLEAALHSAEAYLVHSLESETYAPVWISGTAGSFETGRPVNDIYSLALMLHENEWLAQQPISVQLLTEIYALREEGLFPHFRTDKLPVDLDLLPADVDNTSLMLSNLHKYELLGLTEDDLDNAARKIIANTDADEIIQIYIDRDHPRIDPVVCANALYIINLAGRGAEARATENHVYALLRNRGHEDGTLYFPSPDIFLYFIFRLVRDFPHLHARFVPPLTTCIQERVGASESAIDIAMRMIMCSGLGIRNGLDSCRLLKLQRPDGSWDPSPLYRYPSVSATAYCRTLETAFAAEAIRLALQDSDRQDSQVNSPAPFGNTA